MAKNSNWLLLCGWLTVVWSCSIRQTGLGIALGFTISVLVSSKFNRRWILGAILPSLGLSILVISYPKILEATIGLPSMYNIPTNMMKQAVGDLLKFHLGVLIFTAKNLFLIFVYVGLSMLPLTGIFPDNFIKYGNISVGKIRVRVIILLVIFISSILFKVKWLMPMTQNILIDFGLGVRTLPGSETLSQLPILLWLLVTIAAVFGACILVAFLMKLFQSYIVSRDDKYRSESTSFLTIFLVVLLIVYNLPFLLIYTPWFDRYVILNIAIFGILLIHNFHPILSITRKRITIAGLILIFYLSFGVAGTHDYLEWNRQRWIALDQLTNTRGIAPELIDGGFEYNNYQPRITGNQPKPPDQVDLFKPHAPYRLAFSALPGYQILENYPCRTWLWGSPQRIVVLFSPKG